MKLLAIKFFVYLAFNADKNENIESKIEVLLNMVRIQSEDFLRLNDELSELTKLVKKQEQTINEIVLKINMTQTPALFTSVSICKLS